MRGKDHHPSDPPGHPQVCALAWRRLRPVSLSAAGPAADPIPDLDEYGELVRSDPAWMRTMNVVFCEVTFDPVAKQWIAKRCSVDGIHGEGETLDSLRDVLAARAADRMGTTPDSIHVDLYSRL